MQPLVLEVFPLQLSNVFWWVISLFFRKSDIFLCANPFITKYKMEPPGDPKTRLHYGVLQIELLRGEGGRSLWIDAPGQLDEIIQSFLPPKKS